MTEAQQQAARRFPGLFIVIEGIDGSGSTTHSKLLAKALRQRGIRVAETCEPSGGPIGGMIRQVLQRRLFVADAAGPRAFAWSTMALLFAADRMDHLDSTVVPALRDGAVVISDRYDLSSLAYQSATAPTGEKVVSWIRELNARAIRPDLTIVIDVPPEVAEERRCRGAVRGARPPSAPVRHLSRSRAASSRRSHCARQRRRRRFGRRCQRARSRARARRPAACGAPQLTPKVCRASAAWPIVVRCFSTLVCSRLRCWPSRRAAVLRTPISTNRYRRRRTGASRVARVILLPRLLLPARSSSELFSAPTWSASSIKGSEAFLLTSQSSRVCRRASSPAGPS